MTGAATGGGIGALHGEAGSPIGAVVGGLLGLLTGGTVGLANAVLKLSGYTLPDIKPIVKKKYIMFKQSWKVSQNGTPSQ